MRVMHDALPPRTQALLAPLLLSPERRLWKSGFRRTTRRSRKHDSAAGSLMCFDLRYYKELMHSSRRTRMKPHIKFLTAAMSAAAFALALTAQAQTPPTGGGTLTPIRPPAVPLIVRSPYVSIWQGGSRLAGTWPSFWAGRTKAITGIARIDGKPFVFLGSPAGRRTPAGPGHDSNRPFRDPDPVPLQV